MRALFKIANNIFDKNKGSNSLPQHDNALILANQFNDFFVKKINKFGKKSLTQVFVEKTFFIV